MTSPSPTPGPGTPRPPGWYPDDLGVMRFWDGKSWTEHTAPPPPPTQAVDTFAAAPPVAGTSPYPAPAWVQPNVRQAHDRAQYTRPQTGHSLVKHLLFGWALGYMLTIYYAVSPNHYFHA